MSPAAITVDAIGTIYMADEGGNRIVQMDDITGTGWTTFGTVGS
jgi:hypothetical protein